MFRWLFRPKPPATPTRAAQIALDDARQAGANARFAHGSRPLIRWDFRIGSDEATQREAIFLTTTALADACDYALHTEGVSARRARTMLELSTQPAEWRAAGPADAAKRLRPQAAELILPAGLAIERRSAWFDAWADAAGAPHTLTLPQDLEKDGVRLVAHAPVRPAPDLVQRFAWLGNSGQWGVPGWSLPDPLARLVVEQASAFAGRAVLELGTSRGRLAAMLASLGCRVTTVDHQDRGARSNLDGLGVEVVQANLVAFLDRTRQRYDLVVCDLHGNSQAEWRHYRKPLLRAVGTGGRLVLNNAALHRLDGWESETGVPWFLSTLPRSWAVELHTQTLPGIAVVTRH